MNELVFSTVAHEIKRAMGETNILDPSLVEALYSIVLEPCGLQVGSIDKATASKILNRKAGGEVSRIIRECISERDSLNQIEASLKAAVEKHILKHVTEDNQKKLLCNLREVIEHDKSVPEEKRAKLLAYAQAGRLAELVGHSVLYACTVANVADSESRVFEGFKTRFRLFLNQGTIAKPQRKTCEQMAQMLSFGRVQSWCRQQLPEDRAEKKKLKDRCAAFLEAEKEKMPPNLTDMIASFINACDDARMMILAGCWAQFCKNADLFLLFCGDPEQDGLQNDPSVPSSEYAKCISQAHLPSEYSENIFSFRNKKIGFRGRSDGLQRLEAWLGRGFVSVWAVTGPGGSGKSRLALHFADKMEKENKAKAVWLDKALLEKLQKCDDYNYPRTVLFICDYASQCEDQLKDLIDKMSWTQASAKFLLLERSEAWYISFLNSNDSVKERVYLEESLNLDEDDLSDMEYAQIMQDFSNARYGGKTIPKNMQVRIIQKARTLSGGADSVRCLFLMLLTDYYLRSADISRVNATDLLHNYIDHSRDIARKQYGKEIVKRGYRILAYATAGNGIEWEEPHPAVQNDLDAVIQHFTEDKDQINRFFSQLSESEGTDVVSAVKPDLIGEFLFLNEWGSLLKTSRKEWLSALLQQEYGRTFLALCLTDWREESEQLEAYLSDPSNSEDLDFRVLCADVFREAVYVANAEPVQAFYADKIKSINTRFSAAVLLQYTHAVRYIFKHSGTEIRDECARRMDEICLERFVCETDEEKQHLSEVLSDIAGVYRDIGEYEKALDCLNTATQISYDLCGQTHPYTAKLIYKTGRLYMRKGDYARALEYYEKALMIREHVLGTDHTDSAEIYSSIAIVYQEKGDYETAVGYFNRALGTFERYLGTNHYLTAITYNHIGVLYQDLGEYDHALEYYQKSLAIIRTVLGEEHPYTATAYNNIGKLYKYKGDYGRAQECYTKALSIREAILGTRNPDTAMSYNNLGMLYKSKGEYRKALEYYEKALKIRETVLGEEHADTAATYNNIGILYRYQGVYDAALQFLGKALMIREKVLGKDHPYTARTYNSIASVYQSLHDYAKALDYLERALAVKKKVFGAEHHETAWTYNKIADVYRDKGAFEKALLYYKKALVIRKAVLGTNHPYTAATLNSIARIYQAQNQNEKALEYYEIALNIRQKVLGTEHPDTAMTYNNIASVYLTEADYSKSLNYYMKALEICRKTLGEFHPDTATTYHYIAELYYQTGGYPEAAEYCEKALSIRTALLGSLHPDTVRTEKLLHLIRTL